jgi:hypothetical protein
MGYRYRVQVGNEYTYRESGLELDHLIQDLLPNKLDAQLDALLAKLRRSGVGAATSAKVKQPKKKAAPKKAGSETRRDQDQPREVRHLQKAAVA